MQELHVSLLSCTETRTLISGLAALQLPRLSLLKLANGWVISHECEVDVQVLAGARWFTQLRSLVFKRVLLDASGLRPLLALALPALEQLTVELLEFAGSLCDEQLPPVLLPKLKRLELKDFEFPSNAFTVPSIAALLAAQQGEERESSLEVLSIFNGAWAVDDVSLLMSCLATLPLHRLRHVSFGFYNFSDAALAHLLTAPWLSSLVELSLNDKSNYWVRDDFGVDIEVWEAFAAAPLSRLRVLDLMCAGMVPEAATLLGNAPWLTGLTHLAILGLDSQTGSALRDAAGYQALLNSRACMLDVRVLDDPESDESGGESEDDSEGDESVSGSTGDSESEVSEDELSDDSEGDEPGDESVDDSDGNEHGTSQSMTEGDEPGGELLDDLGGFE